jgi:hypothetical protein
MAVAPACESSGLNISGEVQPMPDMRAEGAGSSDADTLAVPGEGLQESAAQDPGTSPDATADDGPADAANDAWNDAARMDAPDATDLGPLLDTDLTPEPCASDADCSDGDPCTVDGCAAGACQHQLFPPGWCCDDDEECDDGIGCTIDSCKSGKCFHTKESNLCCVTDGDCEDFDVCTLDVCVRNGCAHVFMASDTVCKCQDVLDCNDGLACTSDWCKEGACYYTPAPDTGFCCAGAAECDDGNPTTLDACEYKTCESVAPTTCVVAAHCDDENPCTADACDAGTCSHASLPACCRVDGECNDPDGFTFDSCVSNVCVHSKGSTPAPCLAAAECNDNNTCSAEDCVAGFCSYQILAATGCCTKASACKDDDPCTVESCDDFHCTTSLPDGPVPHVSWSFPDIAIPGFEVESDGTDVKWQASFEMFTSAPFSLYFGDPKGPTINNGQWVKGKVKSPPVTLPAAGPFTLKAWTFIDVEPLLSRDLVWISIIDGDKTIDVWDKAHVGGSTSMTWKPVEVDLDQYGSFGGHTIRVQFAFISVDAKSNDYTGVYFDDVEILWPCPAP